EPRQVRKGVEQRLRVLERLDDQQVEIARHAAGIERLPLPVRAVALEAVVELNVGQALVDQRLRLGNPAAEDVEQLTRAREALIEQLLQIVRRVGRRAQGGQVELS